MNPPTVINIHSAPEGWKDDPQYVYIGRAVPRLGLRHGVCHNPFRIDKDGTREECIEAFRKHMTHLCETHPLRSAVIRVLTGKTLVCWCKPQACHGDVLVELWHKVMGVEPEGGAA